MITMLYIGTMIEYGTEAYNYQFVNIFKSEREIEGVCNSNFSAQVIISSYITHRGRPFGN